MVPHKEVSSLKNVGQDAHQGAQPHNTRRHACSSARNVVQNACVFLLVPTATSNFALATTIGRPNEEAPSALRFIIIIIFFTLITHNMQAYLLTNYAYVSLIILSLVCFAST